MLITGSEKIMEPFVKKQGELFYKKDILLSMYDQQMNNFEK